MKFFDFNYLAKQNGGTISQTSGVGSNAFNESSRVSWTSEGQNTDGTTANVSQTLDEASKFTHIMVLDTNISDLKIEYKSTTVTTWTELTSSDYDKILSKDGKSHYFALKGAVLNNIFTDIRVGGDNTSPANNEKTISNIFGFSYIGDLLGFSNVRASKQRRQSVLKLMSGGVMTINKSFYYEFNIDIEVNSRQSDVDTLNLLRNNFNSFYVWINGGYDNVFKVNQEPFNFNNVFKVSIKGNNTPNYYKNYFSLGITDKLKLVEQAVTL